MNPVQPDSTRRANTMRCIILGLLILGISQDVKALDLSAHSVISYSNYVISPAPTSTTAGIGVGGGLTLGFELFPMVSLELGLNYLDHNVTLSSGGSTTSITYGFYEIPALFRFMPVSFAALEFGFYYGIAGSASFTGTIPSSLVDSTTNPSFGNDMGAMAGLGLRFPFLPMIDIRLDSLLKYGVNNISAGTVTQYSRNVDTTVGFMIYIP